MHYPTRLERARIFVRLRLVAEIVRLVHANALLAISGERMISPPQIEPARSQKVCRTPTIPTNCEGPDDGVPFCESPTTATASVILVAVLPVAIKVWPRAS